MVEPRDLFSDTVLYGATEVVTRSIPFLLLPVFTAFLTPVDFGVSAIVATMVVFLAPVFSLGLGASTAPCYFAHADAGGRRTTINTAILIILASSLVVVALTIVFADQVSLLSFGRTGYRQFVVMGAVTTAFSMLTGPLRQYFQFERRARLYVTLSASATLLSVVLSVLLVVVLRRGVFGFVAATMLGQIGTWLLFAAAYAPAFRARFDGPIARRLLRVGLPLIPAFAALFVLQHASKYILQWTRGLEEVGLFSVGFNVGLVLSVIVTGFQSAWVPFFMSYAPRPEEARETLGRVTTYFTYAVGGASLLLYAGARPAVMLLTTAQFQPAWRVVGLSATAQFLNGIFIVLLPGMYFADEVHYVGIIQAVAAGTGLLLNWFLIRSYGFVGAAAAIVLSYALLAALLYGWNRRRGYLRMRYDARRLLAFGAFYVAFAAVLSVDFQLPLVGEAIVSVIATATLAAFVYFQLDARERALVKQMIMTTGRGRRAAADRVLAPGLQKNIT